MIIIEATGVSGSLLKNVPKEILGKLNISFDYYKNEEGEIEVIILYGERLEIVKQKVEQLGASFEDLGYGYAIVTLNISKLIELELISEIQYIELPKSLFYSDMSSNIVACVDRARDDYKLDGSGVIVGFIDTGIDFTHPAFRNEDGTTRIEYIYDLSIKQVFDKNMINEALKNKNPYDIVPSFDVSEHGTHVAGIACAGGKINPKYYGVAPKSSIIMVKSGRGYFSLSTNLLRGLKFLLDKSNELNMPLSINISMSTNDGAHNGTSLLEQYIGTIARSERVTISIAAGNEGDAFHHKGGRLKSKNIIKFQIANDETAVVMNLYKSVLPKVSIELIAPTGATTGEIVIEEGYKEGVISGNKYQFYDTGPKPFDIAGEIGISLISYGNNILSGEWSLIINVINNYKGVYDIWLPISEGLNKKTKFYEPTIDGTLGIPATVANVISVGSYNYITRNISSFSGRGRIYPLYLEQKPDLVAPGEGIKSTIPNNSFDSKSGTSMATPHVSGICALLMQWGIVNGNDRYLYGERLKHCLVIGSKKDRRDIEYPNDGWGYGEVCAYNSLQQISDVLNIVKTREKRQQVTKFNSVQEYINSLENFNEKIGLLVEYRNEEAFNNIKNMPDTSIVKLSPLYAMVYTYVKNIKNILEEVVEIIDYYNPAIFTLTDISPIQASNILEYQDSPYTKINGKGVIIGIIDTGIDYLSTEFQKEDNTTRIISLWDQTIETNSVVDGIELGTEYSESQINEAIKLSNLGGDPYSIVPSKDEVGHGTVVASVAGARGKNIELIGAAPQAQFIIVKLKPLSKKILELSNITVNVQNAYSYVDVYSAIRYITRKVSRLKKPVSIILPLGTNIGPHDGKSTIAASIDNYSSRVDTIIVTGTGNNGDTDTHKEDIIMRNGDTSIIELKVGKNQKTLNFEIWINKPDVYSMTVISPSGESFERVVLKASRVDNFRFAYEGTLMELRYTISDNKNGDECILVRAVDIKEGIWRFVLHGDYVVNKKYYAWLPQRELLDEETRFLNASVFTTLSDQATSEKVLSVAYYNQNNNTVVGQSGRGYTRNNSIKPDIAAGGIAAKVVRPGNIVGTASGSSIATAVVGGILANILQWTAIEENIPNIFSQQMKSSIIRGSRIIGGREYPNREWGYGFADETGILNSLRGEYDSRMSNYEEYNVRGLFVRLPKE